MLVMLLNVDIKSRLIDRLRYLYCTCIILFLLVLLVPYVTANWNPYDVIGVRHDASLNQIKKAYRELARKLHPDKSHLNEEESGKRFIELNKAFSILKDPDRRSRFDHYGDTEENSRQSRNHQGHHRAQQTREYWTHGGQRTFTFFSSSTSQLRRRSVSARQYYNDYLKESKTRLFFIFFYSDICPSCSVIESSWIKIIDELAKYNIGSFTVNVYQESRLSQDLGVSSIPHIACLIDGQLKTYYQSQLSLSNIVKFTKSILPNNLVTFLQTESEQDRFIALGPQQNRLSAIIITRESNLKLRYLVLAFELRYYYRFGHLSTQSSDYSMLIKKYSISIESDSPQTHLIVFNEDISKPIHHITLDFEHFDIVQLKKPLTKWPFLQLPKLFSQQRFDDLCLYAIPKEGERVQMKLCVILFVTDTPSSLGARNKLIEFIKLNKLIGDERVVFSYLDPAKQTKFMSLLLEETKSTRPSDTEVDNSIIIIERSLQSRSKARYKWLKSRWETKNLNELDRAKLELHQSILEYKHNSLVAYRKLALDPLVDEEGPNLVYKILLRLIDHIMRSIHFITSRESFSSVTILAMCALIASLFLYQSPNSLRDQSPHMPNEYGQPTPAGNFNSFSSPRQATNIENDELKIIELKAETYNGMIRLLKPGYRSIIVLTTKDTRDVLLTEFKKAVLPYRRNKTLLFGYLCLDKNLDWYRSLLQEAIGVGDLNVNKKNCIGTVLSLNGFKKYFRVYHSKHRENKYDYDDDETEVEGSFLGFNERFVNDVESVNLRSDDNLNNSSSRPLLVDNLLAGLPIWLDKMFDGLTKRYSLDNWPEDIN